MCMCMSHDQPMVDGHTCACHMTSQWWMDMHVDTSDNDEAILKGSIPVHSPTRHHTDQLATIVGLYGSMFMTVSCLNREQLLCPM